MEDVSKLCRVCLKPGTISMSAHMSGIVHTVELLLKKYSILQYSEQWLPRVLCTNCTRHLVAAHRFHLKYERSHRQLAQLRTTDHPVLCSRYLTGKSPKEITILPKGSFEELKPLVANVTSTRLTGVNQEENYTDIEYTNADSVIEECSAGEQRTICNKKFKVVDENTYQATAPQEDEFELMGASTDSLTEGAVRCKLCWSKFATMQRYVLHRQVHKAGNICVRCNAAWRSPRELSAHARQHGGFLCRLCDWSCTARASLAAHCRRRHDMKTIPYYCGLCENSVEYYTELDDVKNHLNTNHSEENDKNNSEVSIEETEDNTVTCELKSEVNEVINVNESIADDVKVILTENDDYGRHAINLSLGNSVNVFEIDLKDKTFFKVEDFIENNFVIADYNSEQTNSYINELEIKESAENLVCTTADERIEIGEEVEYNYELLTENLNDEILIEELDEKANDDDTDKNDNVKSVREEEEPKEDAEGVDGEETATIRYYVVDNDNGDNLIEISTEQAQLLVSGETLPATGDSQNLVLSGESKPHECAACGARFTRRYNLSRHAAMTHGAHALRCLYCETRFNNTTLYEVHKMECKQRRKQDPERKANLRLPPCPICEKRFSNRSLMVQHVAARHADSAALGDRGEQSLCKICNKTLTSWTGFQYHMRRHSGAPGRFACDVCGRRFTTRTAQRNHAATRHSQRRPLLCTVCGRGFVSNDHLRKHLRLTHGGRRDFLCVTCGQAFQQASHLAQHQWVHTGVKPHVCRYCQVRYSTQSSLKKHTQRTHGAELAREGRRAEQRARLVPHT